MVLKKSLARQFEAGAESSHGSLPRENKFEMAFLLHCLEGNPSAAAKAYYNFRGERAKAAGEVVRRKRGKPSNYGNLDAIAQTFRTKFGCWPKLQVAEEIAAVLAAREHLPKAVRALVEHPIVSKPVLDYLSQQAPHTVGINAGKSLTGRIESIEDRFTAVQAAVAEHQGLPLSFREHLKRRFNFTEAQIRKKMRKYDGRHEEIDTPLELALAALYHDRLLAHKKAVANIVSRKLASKLPKQLADAVGKAVAETSPEHAAFHYFAPKRG